MNASIKCLWVAGMLGMALTVSGGNTNEDPWERARRGGVVLLMRHGRTGPGGRGPMDLEDRRTQRLLSPEGEEQTARIGRVLKAEGVDTRTVRSSRLFRARDTARFAFGDYETWEVLDALDAPGGPPHAERTRQLRELFAGMDGPGNVVLVTHSPNVHSIIGRAVAEGSVLVLEPDGQGGVRLIGSLDIDARARELGVEDPPDEEEKSP